MLFELILSLFLVLSPDVLDGPRIVRGTSHKYDTIVGPLTTGDTTYFLGFGYASSEPAGVMGCNVINVGDYVTVYWDGNLDTLADRIYFYEIEYMHQRNDTLYVFPNKKFYMLVADEDCDGTWDTVFKADWVNGEHISMPYEEWLKADGFPVY